MRPLEAMTQESVDVTQLLLRWNEGDKQAFDALVPHLYERLREMAHARLRGERSDHTLGTTALVHEAYLRLVEVERVGWQDRSHFFAIASTIMRRILVDYARRRSAHKRGGSEKAIPLNDRLVPDDRLRTILELDDALERLAKAYDRPSKAMELYYFTGLTLEETGEVLGVSAATAMRDIRFAKVWLAREWKGAAQKTERQGTSQSPRIMER